MVVTRRHRIVMITMVLDGYNVIGAVPELDRQWDHNPKAAREALITICQEYRALRKDVERLYVVFDGSPVSAHEPQHTRGGVIVLFTRGEDADERIVSMVRDEEGCSRFVVVSEDKDVIHKARALGARVMPVKEFYGKIRPSRRRQAAPHEGDDKVMPSPHDARQITEELRKHLEKA